MHGEVPAADGWTSSHLADFHSSVRRQNGTPPCPASHSRRLLAEGHRTSTHPCAAYAARESRAGKAAMFYAGDDGDAKIFPGLEIAPAGRSATAYHSGSLSAPVPIR